MINKEYKFGKFGGITLISLVITIVVLIILASVGIYLSLGNNGIFTRANEAKEVTNKQTATEIINLKITNCQMNKYAEEQRMPTLKELSEALIDDEIQYVTEESQVSSTIYKVGENPSSIYTKLYKYPYEFEINAQLQLASIDGIKIATNNTEKSTVLFEGNLAKEAEVQLSENLSNFQTIKVYFKNITTSTNTNCAILEFNTSEIISSGNFHIYDCDGAWKYGGSYLYDSNTNKIKNSINSYSGGTTYSYVSDFCLQIYKIIGIK